MPDYCNPMVFDRNSSYKTHWPPALLEVGRPKYHQEYQQEYQQQYIAETQHSETKSLLKQGETRSVAVIQPIDELDRLLEQPNTLIQPVLDNTKPVLNESRIFPEAPRSPETDLIFMPAW